MKEIWKDVEGFPRYKVSNYGKVSGPRKPELKWCYSPKSIYPKVTLCRNGKRIDKRVNRLVATAFHENPDNLPLVMHGDNNPQNNRSDNLQWGTYSENNQYAYDCGRRPMSIAPEIIEMGNAARREGVIAINIATREKTTYISQHEAARDLGVSQQHIWGVLNGYRRSAGGYYFRYLNEEKDRNRPQHHYPIRMKMIKVIDVYSGEELIFRTRKEATQYTGVSDYMICRILDGRREQSRGYTFEHVDEEEYYD